MALLLILGYALARLAAYADIDIRVAAASTNQHRTDSDTVIILLSHINQRTKILL